MSDMLVDLVSHWQQHVQLILPVAGAIILVVVVYLCSLGSTPPPSLILADEPITTKKEKALAKKRLKQQQTKVSDWVYQLFFYLSLIIDYAGTCC